MERLDRASATDALTGGAFPMVRLKDIAHAAGISVMTASRALRDGATIAGATKQRVHALARQMGYVPNLSARGLRTRTSRLFGVLVPSVADPLWGRVLAALEDHSHDLGYDLLVAHSLGQVGREDEALRRLAARGVDGLFVAPASRLSPAAPTYEQLQRRGARVVVLGPKPAFCEPFAAVTCQDALGAGEATRHLFALGHRRIAFLAGPQASPAAQARLEGYRRALREAALEPDERLVFSAGLTREDGAKAALQMLEEAAPVTAVQAVNDLVAMGAAEVFLAQGLRVPGDLSVVGFGDFAASGLFRVPLSTVDQPKYRLGVTALELMRELLRGKPAETRHLPVGLLARASTAAVSP